MKGSNLVLQKIKNNSKLISLLRNGFPQPFFSFLFFGSFVLHATLLPLQGRDAKPVDEKETSEHIVLVELGRDDASQAKVQRMQKKEHLASNWFCVHSFFFFFFVGCVVQNQLQV
jgi:hypothetical protein